MAFVLPHARTVAPILALALVSLAPALAQEPTPDPAIMARIREEGLRRSQLPQTISFLTEVIGPRLTGSSGMKRANEWTRDKMTEWGLANAHLEAWGPFGRGWTLERFSAQVVGPTPFPIVAYPKAWSPSVRVEGELVYVTATNEEELAAYKGKLKGKIVLVGALRDVPAHFSPEGTRFSDADLEAMTAPTGGGRRRGGAPAGLDLNAMTDEQRAEFQRRMAQRAFAGRIAGFCKEQGAAAILDSARGDGGNIFVQQASVATPPAPPTATTPAPAGGPAPRPRRVSPWQKEADGKILPQIAVSVEHFNRLARMAQAGETPRIALELKARYETIDGGMAQNTVAELPGSDKADEVVLCGAHLDSWHGGTGATDNASGSVVCMEALRILKALGVKPRRTIRMALWSGEEQGLFGSTAYVAQHYGTRQEPKPEHGKVSVYFNYDNGTGKIRGVYGQGNDAILPIFATWLKPFADLGATTVTRRNTGSTDHVPFDAVGIPGFQFIQDEVEYDTRTHHSTQDVYDRLQIDDLKQSAVVLAAFLYNAAMRDELLPRKAAR